MLELTVKLTSNELISSESKAPVVNITEKLKEQMGANEYFAASRRFEEDKRKRREEIKIS